MNTYKDQMQMQHFSPGYKNESVEFRNEQMKQKHKDKRWCGGGGGRRIWLKLKVEKLEKEAEYTHVV